MQVEIEDAGKCRKVLKFEIPVEQVKEKIEDKYGKLLKEADMPGFRRGHVPRKLLERRLGKRIDNEIKEEIMSTAVKEAIDTHKLTLLSELEMPKAEDINLDSSAPFKFQITVMVRPEVSITDYLGVEVETEEAVVTEEDIQKEIERLQRQTAELIVAEGRPVALTDTLICAVTVSCEETEIFSSENAYLFPASKGLFGIEIAELSSKLVGQNRGDSVEVTFTLPKTSSLKVNKNLVGKDATAVIRINEIKELKKPEATDDWAKNLGFENIEQLKSKLNESVHQAKETAWKLLTEQMIMAKIMQKTQFDVPSELIAKRAEQMVAYRAFRLQDAGVEQAKIDADIKEYREYTQQEIERLFREDLIVQKIAEMENIFVTEEEVDAEVARVAREKGVSEAELLEQLEAQDMLSQLREDMLKRKIRSFLREKANVKVLPPGSLKSQPEQETSSPETSAT